MYKHSCDCGTCRESDIRLMNDARRHETGHLDNCGCEICRDFKEDFIRRAGLSSDYIAPRSDSPIQQR